MLEEILRHLNNWFLRERHEGAFTVEKGGLVLPFLQEGQYFRIVGSIFNDGLHRYPAENLTEETFTGSVWALAVPPAVVSLAEEIAAWQVKQGAAALSPYQSESFTDYSYTRATDAQTGGALTWQAAFRGRLNVWRRIKGAER